MKNRVACALLMVSPVLAVMVPVASLAGPLSGLSQPQKAYPSDRKEPAPEDTSSRAITVSVTSQQKPLEGATVYVESLEGMVALNKKRSTDAQGMARFTVDPHLLYTVSVIKDGYRFGQDKVCKPGTECRIGISPLPPGTRIYTTAHNHMGPPFLVPYVGVTIWGMEVERDKRSGLPMGGARLYARNYTAKIDGKSNKAGADKFFVEVPMGRTFKIEQDGKSASAKIVGWRKSHVVAEWVNNGLVNESGIAVQENTAWYKVEEER